MNTTKMIHKQQHKRTKKDGLNTPPNIDAPSSFPFCLFQRIVMCECDGVQYVCFVWLCDE